MRSWDDVPFAGTLWADVQLAEKLVRQNIRKGLAMIWKTLVLIVFVAIAVGVGVYAR